MKDYSIYLFGSPDSFLNSSDSLYERLENTGADIYINLGLESFYQNTLDYIRKPITEQQVHQSFNRMMEINHRFNHIEITANFVLGDNLPSDHYSKFIQIARDGVNKPQIKGTLYFSPLLSNNFSKNIFFYFNQIKRLSRYPTFLYTIQRL